MLSIFFFLFFLSTFLQSLPASVAIPSPEFLLESLEEVYNDQDTQDLVVADSRTDYNSHLPAVKYIDPAMYITNPNCGDRDHQPMCSVNAFDQKTKMLKGPIYNCMFFWLNP